MARRKPMVSPRPFRRTDPDVHRFALFLLLRAASQHGSVRGAGHGTNTGGGGGGGGGGTAVPSAVDGGLLEAWDGSYSGNPADIPTGNMLATFTPTQTGAFDASGTQLATWNGTVYVAGTPTFWILRSLDGTTRLHVSVGAGGITLDNSIDGLAWQVGRKLTLTGGVFTGTNLTATVTKGTYRLGHELEFPRLTVDVTTIPTTSGATVVCEAADDPVAKYATTGPNDLFQLRAGQSWTLTDTIVIGTSHAKVISTTGTLPAPGTAMVGSAEAATYSLPKLVCASGKPAISVANSVRNWRVMGVEVTCDPNEQNNAFSSLIEIGTDTIPNLNAYPYYGGVDRCFIHGWTNAWKKSGIAMRGGHVFAVDCEISEIHYRTTITSPSDGNLDAQAISYFHGPGPIRVKHCKLESNAEQFALGSNAEPFNGLVPSDGVVEQCFLTAKQSWHATNPETDGHHTRKNNAELKKGRRFHFKNCVTENTWVDNQSGESFMLWSGGNSLGAAPWSQTCDICLENILVRGTAGGIIFDSGYFVPAEWAIPFCRAWVKNVAFIWLGDHNSMNFVNDSGLNFGVQINNSTGDPTRTVGQITIEHCDFGHKADGNLFPSMVQPVDQLHQDIVIRSNKGTGPGSPFSATMLNVQHGGGTGDIGYAVAMGAGCSWTNNLLLFPGAQVNSAQNLNQLFNMVEGLPYSPGHVYSDSTQTTRAAVLNLALDPTDPGKHTGHDGADPGVDATALYNALAGVIA